HVGLHGTAQGRDGPASRGGELPVVDGGEPGAWIVRCDGGSDAFVVRHRRAGDLSAVAVWRPRARPAALRRCRWGAAEGAAAGDWRDDGAGDAVDMALAAGCRMVRSGAEGAVRWRGRADGYRFEPGGAER